MYTNSHFHGKDVTERVDMYAKQVYPQVFSKSYAYFILVIKTKTTILVC